MRRLAILLGAGIAASCAPEREVDLLLVGGLVYDGTGSEPARLDIGIEGERIVFVGDASAEGVSAPPRQRLDVRRYVVTPGFIDMHSHAELDEDYGRGAAPFLHQGITTVLIGLDGGGSFEVAETLAPLQRDGIGVNAMTFVGHGAVRREVLGLEDRAPSEEELERMKELVRKGMEEGALGLSSGLFYVPGTYAETDEVVELARVAAEYGGIYDTHDRDLGASYKGIGYLASIREGIEIGERSGARVIFSHFNAQGAHNYGRAPEGAALIDEARARGVDVAAAQHVYTATQSSLAAYALPRWASAGGQDAMLARFGDDPTVARLDVETMEMLAIRGGAQKILIVDEDPELNGRTLENVAEGYGLSVPETVRRILSEGNVPVMNLELYDMENTRFLATREWMMTCTDGRDPRPDQRISHPRVYGAFTKKLRQFAIEEGIISLPFAIRSMTGLAADFLRLPDRGYVREGAVADLAVLDLDEIEDLATYETPRRFSRGTVHVLVNGELAIEDGELTGTLAGKTLTRP